MRLLIVMAAIAIPFASSPARGPAAPVPSARTHEAPTPLGRPGCPRSNFHYADEQGTAEAKRLHELPPASLILAVVRNVDGCQEPVIVRYGYGLGGGLREKVETELPRPRARRW